MNIRSATLIGIEDDLIRQAHNSTVVLLHARAIVLFLATAHNGIVVRELAQNVLDVTQEVVLTARRVEVL